MQIWFQYSCHTGPHVALAFRSPQSKLRMYGSIPFLYDSLQLHTCGIQENVVYTYMPSIHIPTVKTSHIRFPMVPVQFLYDSIHVVYTYMPSIQIPAVKTSHIWFHMVPEWFSYSSLYVIYTYMPSIHIPAVKTLHIRFPYGSYMAPYMWYTHACLAFTFLLSKLCKYGSIQFLYGSCMTPYMWYTHMCVAFTFLLSKLCIYGSILFLEGTLHFSITGFYTVHHCRAKK